MFIENSNAYLKFCVVYIFTNYLIHTPIFVISKVGVAPTGMGLVMGSGHVYSDAIMICDQLVCYTPYQPSWTILWTFINTKENII